MSKKQYVQHVSGQGEKWELYTDQSPTYGEAEWRVKAKAHDYFHDIPKSEFIICDPPEEWEDVTGAYDADDLLMNPESCVVKRLRLRKIDGTHNGPAFIVEKKL